MAKPELEYFPVEEFAWTEIKGKVSGLTTKILSRDPDTGIATRMLRFAPGTNTSPNGVLVHDYWEECYILDGFLEEIDTGRQFTAGSYCCRPPGMPHGRWISPEGCTVFEVRYAVQPKS